MATADNGAASELSGGVIGVAGDAVGYPLLADVEGNHLGVVGDVGSVAIGAGAGPLECVGVA